MGIRDNEIERLIKYAEGLGIKLFFKKHKPGSAGATWTVAEDNTVELTLFAWKNQSKTQMILNFLHELAHHMAWVYQERSFSSELSRILNKNHDGSPLTKKERYAVFKEERDDSVYRETIAHEIGIKIPTWKIKVDIELDIFIYYHYYEHDEYPSNAQVKQKRKELNKKYKENTNKTNG
jgi:hypothetical protein